MRLDLFLVDSGLVSTRSKAKDLIKRSCVFVNDKINTKPSYLVSEDDNVRLTEEVNFVSRGALKLKTAIEAFKIDVAGLVVADVGASTGGFTDYLLQNDIKKSYCIDVGHGQLDPKIESNKRVVSYEGINIKYSYELPEKVDLVVTDLSFISLHKVIHILKSLGKDDANFIFLFKPQFEVGQENIGKNGIVKNKNVVKKYMEKFIDVCMRQSLYLQAVVPSSIQGQDGNQEYLLHLNYKEITNHLNWDFL